MDKITEYERMLQVTKDDGYHYENTPGLACTREKSKQFRIACIEELISYEKSRLKPVTLIPSFIVN